MQPDLLAARERHDRRDIQMLRVEGDVCDARSVQVLPLARVQRATTDQRDTVLGDAARTGPQQ